MSVCAVGVGWGRYSAPVQLQNKGAMLHEDVTSPKIKSQFLDKFVTARSDLPPYVSVCLFVYPGFEHLQSCM